MKNVLIITAIAISLMPSALPVSAKQKKAPVAYVCLKCHMMFTKTQAVKDHFKDPMDGGKLVIYKASKSHKSSTPAGAKM